MKFIQVLLLSTALLGVVWIVWQLLQLKPLRGLIKRERSMPEAWPLARRPVLNAHERHVFALMKQAFPQHQVLVKLPLTRFTQLRESKNAAFWYELLTPLTVTFTLCDVHTQAFAVIDILNEGRAGSSATRLKRRALNAAQVRYVRIDIAEVPSVRMLRDLVLSEKEQRDSLWRSSSDAASSGLHSMPSSVAMPSTASKAVKPSVAAAIGIKQTAFEAVNQSLLAAANASEQPVSIQPGDSRLQRQREELQRQIQSRRESRDAQMQAQRLREISKETVPGVDVQIDSKQDLRDFTNKIHEAGAAKKLAAKDATESKRFNLDSIISRDSFLAPDSRYSHSYTVKDGTVSSYTKAGNVDADHIWLDSSPNPKQ